METAALHAELGAGLPPGLRAAVSLADFTTWKVGGAAQWFCEPEGNDQVIGLARWARHQGLSLQVIGAGSNLLISDQGLAGLTLCQRRLQGSQLDGATGLIEAQAGEPIPTLARRAARALSPISETNRAVAAGNAPMVSGAARCPSRAA